MRTSVRRWKTATAVGVSLLVLPVSEVVAFQVRPKASRFDALVVEDPAISLDVATTPLAALARTERLRSAWDGFMSAHGAGWSVYLDRRSGAPMLVEGPGIPWVVDAKSSVDTLAGSLRPFIAANKELLLADDAELALDRDASGQLSPDVWQIVFARMISGVPVDGERYVFTIGHGNLISFGAPRWSRIDADPLPDIDASEAQARMAATMGLTASDGVKLVKKGTLALIPLRAAKTAVRAGGGPYAGTVGAGYASALVWRIAVRVDGEPGTWEAQVDAHTGAVLSLTDINDYAQVKGGVYPVSDDGSPPDGVEQAAWPMPYTDVTSGTSQTATSLGFFNCDGATATTTLQGQYVKVLDTCGAISQQVSCDNDLDLSQGAGTDCVVPGGASAGNTHASRTGFYHLNRISEHARVWLPSRTWLTQQLTDNVNLNQTCNAYWNGSSVNFFKSGGGCNNTGEIAGVFLHEWGHGLDQNDGGGFDNPSEAYADITALMSTHVSCVGRGFVPGSNCTGYGDACLNCTGIRDQDWAQHASATPATPSGFLTNNCGSGSGPCGKEVHCESYVGAETMWDLAVRDLPASGLDLASSWQLADKLWYKSRLGSGGNAYNCALPSSDGCAATSWFAKIRTIDDDDGNLANGTPHAAAIFAAFSRHNIACGLAGDASNQSFTTCPAIGAAALLATAGAGSAQLNWTPVANAAAYNVLRNDASCAAGATIIATIPGTTFTDTGLANGFTEYYTVQAVGTSAACDGLLSNCKAVTPQPFAGAIKLNAGTYSCAATIGVTVTDANIGASTTTVHVTSATEPGGETITLTQVSPGSANYAGAIQTKGGPPAADGSISVVDGDTITATYVDANDGQGGIDVVRTTTAAADCVFPIISNVASSNVTGSSARVTWDTNEASTSVVHFGPTPPPSSTLTVAAPVVAHAVDLKGLAECSEYVYSVASADGVGNTALDDNGAAYYAFQTGKNATPSYPSTDGPVAIPDNSPGGASSVIVVQDGKTIQKVTVTVNITHTFDGDLILHLVGPDATDIILSNRHGSLNGNYINTVFDDAASTPIASGSAPFTGSFVPDAPLATFNGKNAAGAWQLHVVDAGNLDVGTIDTWTLSLTFPAAECGPHATYQAATAITDSCGTGGAGHADGTWDPGERVSFGLSIANDGTAALTHVHATVVPVTPGVLMIQGSAGFPAIPAGAVADSLAPDFTALLPPSAACGGDVAFQVSIFSDEGSWNGGTFSHVVGAVSPGIATALDESFAGGIPGTWTVVDGGSGGGAASTWTTANPGARTFTPPLVAPVAMVDSDNAGPTTGTEQDEQLITPVLNLTGATTATLDFDQYYLHYSGGNVEVADVDVRSSLTGGAWVNVLEQSQVDSPNPDHQTIDVTAQAAGAADAQVRFHYYNGHFEWFWEVDNVKVTFKAPGGCNQNVCATPAGVVKPVADGSFGGAMIASRVDAAGTSIQLDWDVATCSSIDHHVLYGDLANVASASVSGAVCDIGATGSVSWTGAPAGSLWFVVVGDDHATLEGSWGTKTGGERRGTAVSGQCGLTTRDNTGTCP